MKYSKQSDHPVPIVGVIVLNDHGEILLTRRAKEPFLGSWVIPGGRVEVQDDCVEASVIREVKEETGLDIELTHIVGAYSSEHDPRFFVAEVIYVAHAVGGALQTNPEVSEFYWMKKDALDSSRAYGFNHKWLIQQFQACEAGAKKLIPVHRSRYTEWYGKEYPYLQTAYPRFACMAIVLNAKGQVLLAHRAQKPFIGCWDFPGGHTYVDETPEACLKREVKEELGVECAVGEMFHVYSDKGQNPKNADVAVFYFVTIQGDHFVKNVEMDDFRYFSFGQLPEGIAYQNRRVIEDIQKRV